VWLTVAADEGHEVEVLALFFVGEGVGIDDFAAEAVDGKKGVRLCSYLRRALGGLWSWERRSWTSVGEENM